MNSPRVSVPVEYNTRDLLLYALGIGCTDPRFVYEKEPGFAPFPTYPICLTFKGDSYDALPFPPPAMLNFKPPRFRGFKVGLDAEKIIEKVAELPAKGGKLFLVGGVVGIHKKGTGALVEAAYDIQDASGKVYYKIVSSSFDVGAHGFKDSGVTHSRQILPPAGPPAHSIEVPISKHSASLFRLSGDYNPLHVDERVARRGGFDRPILHGLCTLGNTTRVVLDAVAGGDQRRYRSVRMRFAAPVYPGQTLVVRVWPISATQAIFETVVKETGKVCISNGLMELHPQASL